MGRADGCDVGFGDVGSAVVAASDGAGECELGAAEVVNGVGTDDGVKVVVADWIEVGFAVGSKDGMSIRCCWAATRAIESIQNFLKRRSTLKRCIF